MQGNGQSQGMLKTILLLVAHQLHDDVGWKRRQNSEGLA